MKRFVIGSVTKTERARAVLRGNGIASRSGKRSERDGCVHFIEVSDRDAATAGILLSEKGLIPAKTARTMKGR